MTKFLRFWFPAILYSGIIFYASSIPNVQTPLQEIQLDKILHVLVFMPFGFLVARGVYGSHASIPKKIFWSAVFWASFLYGASDELHQSLVPGRNAGVIDLLGDTIGGMAGGYVFLLHAGRNKKRKG